MKTCPKCAKPVDQSGTEWVQLFIDHPFRWSPVCHRECAAQMMRDMSGDEDALPVVQ